MKFNEDYKNSRPCKLILVHEYCSFLCFRWTHVINIFFANSSIELFGFQKIFSFYMNLISQSFSKCHYVYQNEYSIIISKVKFIKNLSSVFGFESELQLYGQSKCFLYLHVNIFLVVYIVSFTYFSVLYMYLNK